jgi:hypothetical protein
MGYLLYPGLAIYTIYSFMQQTEDISYYSFVLRTLVSSIYVFEFICMVPQVYINYKLKSVEHMPQRTLFYRFLNTIIDDLFSFIVTMPTMKRIACFRDDVIFVIFLYQKWIYDVDKTRGLYATEKKKQVTHEQTQPALTSDDKDKDPSKDASTDDVKKSENDQAPEEKPV